MLPSDLGRNGVMWIPLLVILFFINLRIVLNLTKLIFLHWKHLTTANYSKIPTILIYQEFVLFPLPFYLFIFSCTRTSVFLFFRILVLLFLVYLYSYFFVYLYLNIFIFSCTCT